MREEEAAVQLRRARNAAYQLLKVRIRSEKEIRDRLLKREFSMTVIDQVVLQLKEVGLLNDLQFAQIWIRDRLARPFGVQRIHYELQLKGIDRAIIDEEIERSVSEFPEEAVALQLARRRAETYKDVDKEKIKQRVYGFLLRRGFSPGAAVKAIKKI